MIRFGIRKPDVHVFTASSIAAALRVTDAEGIAE